MPGLYSHTSRATGITLTAAIYNADHQNHIDNQTAQMTDDYSVDNTQMQATADPGEVGTESKATSLAGELERLRFALKEIKQSAQWYESPTNTLPRSYLAGLTLSNNATDPTNDIDIAVGTCQNSTNAHNLILASALTKRLDAAWTVGTNQGGLDTGTIANDTYHVHLIKRSDTGVVDALFSLSATAPTMPASYDFRRRIGSIIRAGGTIVAFTQDGDYFQVNVPVNEWNENIAGTTAVTKTLTRVPTGINALWHGFLALRTPIAGATMAILASDLATTDTAPVTVPSGGIGQVFSNPQAAILDDGGEVQVRTNTSAQIRMRANSTTGTPSWGGTSKGWWDRRGRDD